MIKERARVVAVIEPGRVLVEALGRDGCGGCGEAGHCGTALLGKALGPAPARLAVTAPDSVRVGDTVMLGLPEGALLRGAVFAYLLPLAGLFLAGLIAARALNWPETLVVLVAALGFAGGILLARRLLTRRDAGLAPTFLSRLPGAGRN